jgi:hypothetical protein
MNKSKRTMAQQIAHAFRDAQHQRTRRVPLSVAVVLSNDTLVITLPGSLSPAEQAVVQVFLLARSVLAEFQFRQLLPNRTRFCACGRESLFNASKRALAHCLQHGLH